MPGVYRFILGYDGYTENDFTILYRLALLNMSEMSWLFLQKPDALFCPLYKNFFFDKKEYYPLSKFQRSCLYQAHGNFFTELQELIKELCGDILSDNIKPEKYSATFACLFPLAMTYLTSLNYFPVSQRQGLRDYLHVRIEDLIFSCLSRLVCLKMIKAKIRKESDKKLTIEPLFARYRTLLHAVLGFLPVLFNNDKISTPNTEEWYLYWNMLIYKSSDLKSIYDYIRQKPHPLPLQAQMFMLFTEYYLNDDRFKDTLAQFLKFKTDSGFSPVLLDLVLFMLFPKEDMTKLNQLRDALRPIEMKNDWFFCLTMLLLNIITDHQILTDDYDQASQIINPPEYSVTGFMGDFFLLITLTLTHPQHHYISILNERLSGYMSNRDSLFQLLNRIMNNTYYSNDNELRFFYNEVYQLNAMSDPECIKDADRIFELLENIRKMAKNNEASVELVSQKLISLMPITLSDELFEF